MLFNEPKLLKFTVPVIGYRYIDRFSALQRAEIAEIENRQGDCLRLVSFSALQRAEIAEICSVLVPRGLYAGFSALQRAEIAEMVTRNRVTARLCVFQCSSTSRNC